MVEKSKDKRLEEKEKLEAELERSLAVVKVKAAHKQIEDTEKLRKRATVLSICKRIDQFVDRADPVLAFLRKNASGYRDQISDVAMTYMEDFERTYVSICYDFRKSLDVGDEAMEKMFPTLKVRKDALHHAIDDLHNIRSQLQQMKCYCERLLV